MKRTPKVVLELLDEGYTRKQIAEMLLEHEPPYEDMTPEESKKQNRKVIERYVDSIYGRYIVAPALMPSTAEALPQEFIERVWGKYKNQLHTWDNKRAKSVLRLAAFISTHPAARIIIREGYIIDEPKIVKQCKETGVTMLGIAVLKKLPGFDRVLYALAVEGDEDDVPTEHK